MQTRLYFDYNASAPLATGLADQFKEWLCLDPKNPNSVHADGQAANALLETARRKILTTLGAKKSDALVFTSGGTEANNAVMRSAFSRRKNRQTLIVTGVEHSCVRNMASQLEREGAKLKIIPVSRAGKLDLQILQDNLSDAFLVVCMLANNETGYVLPVTEVATLAAKAGVPVLSDAVCAIGKIPFHFSELGIDYATFSAHKFGALKGIGGILYRKVAGLEPFILGGPQELEKRAGTQNLHGVLSTEFALMANLNGLEIENQRQMSLRETFKLGILQIYPQAIFHESLHNLPQTLNVSFPGLKGALLLTNLDLSGISASHGSACASGALEVSPILRHIGLPEIEASSAIRFSFGRKTTTEDGNEFLHRLKTVIEMMV